MKIWLVDAKDNHGKTVQAIVFAPHVTAVRDYLCDEISDETDIIEIDPEEKMGGLVFIGKLIQPQAF